MKANLSLVLDKDGYTKLDLIKDKEISEIDKYTTSYDSSTEIRTDHKEEIDNFLTSNNDFIKTFKREQDKKGRIVITYSDEHNNLHKLRVLYKDNVKKIDTLKMITNIRKTLEEESTFQKTEAIINHFSGFIFGSEFDRKEIKRLQKRLATGAASEKFCNKVLVKNIIHNHLILTFNRNQEKAYFYVRLIDSYLEKCGMFTTKCTTNKRIKNLAVIDVPSDTKIKRDCSEKRLKDGDFYMESDGQYNLFDSSFNTHQPEITSYEDYLEQQEERRLNK